MCDSESMKTLLPLAALTGLLSACGTGLIPPVSKDLPDINSTLPAASALVPVVIYLDQDQFKDLNSVLKNVDTVDITGNLVFTGKGDISSVDIFVRPDAVGCEVGAGYYICKGDESANRLQNIVIEKGTPQAITLAGKPLDAAVKNQHGYIGFRIVKGSTVAGDKISISGAKATARF
jgi:hypothetical protein